MVEMLPKNLYSESHVDILLERARGSNIYMLLQNKLNRISDKVLVMCKFIHILNFKRFKQNL